MKKGFTLIELLIVVAIIAILAAIAVPNFLEAQTRARTSRCMSDMRTLAVAIESYIVDYNRPPVGFNEGVSYGMWAVSDDVKRGLGAYAPLTTPVAYISTVPKDNFIEATQGNTRKWKVYFYESFMSRKTSNGGTPSATSTTGKIMGRGYAWLLRSWGPSRKATTPWETSILANQLTTNIYDATNGTKSTGFLIMTNKGFYKGPGS